MTELQKKMALLLFICMSLSLCKGKDRLSPPTIPETPIAWSVTQKGNILEIAYKTGDTYPQYAALHLNDSYFRMVYSPQSSWGTSVIILPSFWEQGKLYQGAPVSYSYQDSGSDLLISLMGNISSLSVNASIQISPPSENSVTATISVSVIGQIGLDYRPGEAFKLVTLSSMYISPGTWDCRAAYVDSKQFPIPTEGWIIQPPMFGQAFGLEGGSSSWKNNAPTIEVWLNKDVEITGWVTRSNNPNNDNVGFWGASSTLQSSWQYTLTAKMW